MSEHQNATALPATVQNMGTGASPISSLQLLDAYWRGNIQEIQTVLSRMDLAHPLPQRESPLHLAVQCADLSVIEFMLQKWGMNANMHALDTGNTPLHLAVSANRIDVAAMLMEQPNVSEVAVNKDGKTPLQLVKSMDMANLFQHYRTELRNKVMRQLEAFEASADANGPGTPEEKSLLETVTSPRVSALEFEIMSTNSNLNVLQAAVKYKATDVIKACVSKGCDPYVKDAYGRSANDMTNDKMIQALLRQLAHAEATHLVGKQQNTTYRGFLSKWTNYMHGFKMRWFVLADGKLSYYHTPNDEGKQVRGVLNVRDISIIPDRRERNRFEVMSSSDKDSTHWYLRSNDPSECLRWMQILDKAHRVAQQGDGAKSEDAVTSTPSAAVAGVATKSTTDAPQANVMGTSVPILPQQEASVSLMDDGASETGSVDEAHTSIPHAKSFERVSNMMNLHFDVAERLLLQLEQSLNVNESVEQIPSAPVSSEAGQNIVIPQAQGGGPAQAITGVGLSNAPHTAMSTAPDQSFSKASMALALRRSLTDQAQIWQQYLQMVIDREAYLREETDRLDRTRKLWEEQVAMLARQQNELESNLQEVVSENSQMRKGLRQASQSGLLSEEPAELGGAGGTGDANRGIVDQASQTVSATAGAAIGAASSMLSQFLPSKQPLAKQSFDDYDDEFFDTVDSNEIQTNLKVDPSLQKAQQKDVPPTPPSRSQTTEAESLQQGGSEAPSDVAPGAAAAGAAGAAGVKSGKDSDEPSGQGKNEDEDENEARPDETTDPKSKEEIQHRYESPEFEPYRHLRDKMPIRNDERPSMSLWSILKNNIGKDLTKISFPVAFNEPTSMLQRMSEDIEFSECLDAAALQPDSTQRIMYVAAFAMSNYSSTIGRIAKPFNPLLGETYEYVRPDREYRYISEQVSHHPPISACFCESPRWEYMGCVDAKSKFLGRSFEIHPTGVAHAKIKVRPEWVPEAKRNALQRAPDNEGLVMEHYTWNKVTTSVSGFITGSTTIDHFGEMVVTNHATGDKCKLTFQPRGWRSTAAFEIRGEVFDSQNNKVWVIAGRWNTQLIATRSGQADALNPDRKLPTSNPVDSSKSNTEYLLLWRNSKKEQTPFNLTPFAVTLNARPEGLMEWLPPTDCRRRPDLTAFENGKFDKADYYKVKLEELQRSKRRMREEGKLPQWKPQWFSKTVDPDSNESFWMPHMSTDKNGRETMQYWLERSKVGEKRAQNQSAEWDCEHIFGEFENQSG